MTKTPEVAGGNYWRMDIWFPDMDPEVLKQFKIFHDELVKFNKTLSLISPKTVAMADAIHFADAMLASRVIMRGVPEIQEIYDLGSGNGFPGIVFGILYPRVKVHLVEVDQRKCEFMKHVIAALGLSNIDVMNIKIEELKENSVQYAMCRGLASISKVILLMRKFVSKGGIVFHLKGEQWGMEVSEIPIQLCSIWAPGLVGEYRLPVGEVKFAVIKTDKIS